MARNKDEGPDSAYISYRMVCNEPVKVYMYGQDAVKSAHIPL